MRTTKKSICAVTSLVIVWFLPHTAESSVIITFRQVEGNVIATTSGAFLIPETLLYVGSGTPENPYLVSGHNGLAYMGSDFSSYGGGTSYSTGMSIGPDSGIGSSFGYFDDQFLAPTTEAEGSSYSPVTTWTWSGRSLADIGLGGLVETPVIVYTASNGENISFNAVPEPSAGLLLGLLTSIAFSVRRRSFWL